MGNSKIQALRKSKLKFIVDWTLSEVFVKNGECVNVGQEIARLDQTRLQNAVEQARINYKTS